MYYMYGKGYLRELDSGLLGLETLVVTVVEMVPLLPEVVLFHVREQLVHQGVAAVARGSDEQRRVIGREAAIAAKDSVRELALRVVEIVGGQGELLEVVGAARAGSGFTDLLDGGHEQADQDGDDGDDDQQLDQGEPVAGGPALWRDARSHGPSCRIRDGEKRT